MFTHIHVHALAPASIRRTGLVAASMLASTATAMDTSATQLSPQTMEVMINKVAHLKTMLEAPTSDDALLGTLADLDGLGNIATDVFKATAIGN